jgi:hypothetical protein
VIAAADHFNAAGKEFLGEARRDSEAGSGIFAIGDAEIDAALRENVRQAVVNDFSAGRADNVSNK